MKRRTFLGLVLLLPIFGNSKMTMKTYSGDVKNGLDTQKKFGDLSDLEVDVQNALVEIEESNHLLYNNTSSKKNTYIKRIQNAPKRSRYSKKSHIKNKYLNMINSHTGEKLKIKFKRDGKIIQSSLPKINEFFRDFRENKSKHMDLALLDFIHACQIHESSNRPLYLLSGYRTSKTNKKLSRYSRKVAKHSFHIKGMAADIRPKYTSRKRLNKLHKFARKQQMGGVGYYPKNGFIHIDSGPTRHWS